MDFKNKNGYSTKIYKQIPIAKIIFNRKQMNNFIIFKHNNLFYK